MPAPNAVLPFIYSIEMTQETNQTPGPMLCSTGCGFYGNPRTNGMCSVCYKEHLQQQQNSGRISPMGKVGWLGLFPSFKMEHTEDKEKSQNIFSGTSASCVLKQ